MERRTRLTILSKHDASADAQTDAALCEKSISWGPAGIGFRAGAGSDPYPPVYQGGGGGIQIMYLRIL